jgi:hypothetical protein
VFSISFSFLLQTRVVQSVGTDKLLQLMRKEVLLEEYGGTNETALVHVVKGAPASLAVLRGQAPKNKRSNSRA